MRALTRRSAAAATAGVLVLTGVAACGGSTKNSSSTGDKSTDNTKKAAAANPQKAFTDALAKLGTAKSGDVTVKFAATEQQILAFAAATSGKPADDEDKKVAHYLATGTIVVKSKDKAASFDVNLDSKPLIQFVAVPSGTTSDVYLRADVQSIATLAGPSAQAAIAQADGQLPAGFEFVKDAIAGKWLEIDGSALDQIKQLAQSQTSAVPSVNPADVKALQAKIAAALSADLVATDKGSDPKGEHLVLTGNIKKLAADFLDAAKDLPGAGAILTKVDTTQVPDKNVTVDAFITDGGISALQLNLAQFSDKPAAQGLTFPLEVGFSPESGSISAPANPSKVDISKLLGLASQFGAGLSKA